MIDTHGLTVLWERMKTYIQARIADASFNFPVATTDSVGGVRPDGTTITIDGNGVISGASTYDLPKATTDTLGGVMVDGETIIVDDGVISGASTYVLPNATTDTLGGVMVDGETIVSDDGVISATYELQPATQDSIGGVMPDGQTTAVSYDGAMTVIGVPASAITGTIPASVLPSFVDDVIEAYVVGQEYSSGWLSDTYGGTPLTPEQGKIYVVMSGTHENESYRWSGSSYVSIGNPLDIATESEARAGADNTKAMTPLRVAQAVAVLSPTPTYDSQLSATSTNAVRNSVIKSALDQKAPIDSPSFTGAPLAPTPTAGVSNTQIATTEFVRFAIPSWARESTKPTYTASEVGALPDSTHIPSTVAEMSDASSYATKSYADSAYTLPRATDSTLGGVTVDGTTIVASNGEISVPTASTSTKGVVKVDGTTIGINQNGEIYIAIASGDGVSY